MHLEKLFFLLLLCRHSFVWEAIFAQAMSETRRKCTNTKGKREMSSIRAIVVDPEVPGRFVIKEVEAPQPGPAEALVQVEAISLNRGEVVRAMTAEAGWRPGWDLAGTVIKQAANGTG